jgi:Rrf2 family nitric oxide-sensitive transcriptional repressor
MHLTQHTDYALRIVLYLGAHPEETPTTMSISTAFGISANHTATIAKRMVQEGVVVAKRGRGGGLRLAHDPGTIRIGDFVARMERTMHLVECFDPKTNHCPITSVCGLKRALFDARAEFLGSLNRYTLADLVNERPQLVQLLRRRQRHEAAAVEGRDRGKSRR